MDVQLPAWGIARTHSAEDSNHRRGIVRGPDSRGRPRTHRAFDVNRTVSRAHKR
jgi:hypothetical protein